VTQSNPELRYGRIVWARLTDTNGFRKNRPCIILTPTHEIRHDVPLVVMAITTTFKDAPPPDNLPLP